MKGLSGKTSPTLPHDPQYARTRRGVDLERTAVFATILTAVISSLFGAVPALEIGKSFNFFLAEDVIRMPDKTLFQYSVIGHLHIMLALIAILLTLIVGRWLGFKGILHKIAMPLMIMGTVILMAKRRYDSACWADLQYLRCL